MSDKKYEILNDQFLEIEGGRKVYRIRALKDFNDVNKGDIGGYVQTKNNLSQEGNSWVYDDAMVYDSATVKHSAKLFNNAKVYDNAKVFNEAILYDNVEVYDDAEVYGKSVLFDNTKVYEYAEVFTNGDSSIRGNIKIHGDSSVQDSVKMHGNIDIYGTAIVLDNVEIYKNVEIFENARVSGRSTIFGDTLVEIYGDSIVFGNAYVAGNVIICGESLVKGNAKINCNNLDKPLCIDGTMTIISNITEDFKRLFQYQTFEGRFITAVLMFNNEIRYTIGCQNLITKETFIDRIYNEDGGLEYNPHRQEYLDIIDFVEEYFKKFM